MQTSPGKGVCYKAGERGGEGPGATSWSLPLPASSHVAVASGCTQQAARVGGNSRKKTGKFKLHAEAWTISPNRWELIIEPVLQEQSKKVTRIPVEKVNDWARNIHCALRSLRPCKFYIQCFIQQMLWQNTFPFIPVQTSELGNCFMSSDLLSRWS